MIERDPRIRDPAYMAWIARLPCLACLVHGKITWGVHVAHLRAGSEAHNKRPTGGAEKPSDRWTLPLCPPHHVGDHRVVDLTQHSMGELEFWEALGIDPFSVCIQLRAIYADRTPNMRNSQSRAVSALSKMAADARRRLEGEP
jgi:hypothetical protein